MFWIEVRYVGGSSDDIVRFCYERAAKVMVGAVEVRRRWDVVPGLSRAHQAAASIVIWLELGRC